jgi:hypothetical protein
LCRRIYTLFGFSDGEEVIPDPMTERGQNDISDEEELAVLAQGQNIDVKYYDNHIQKISLLQAFLLRARDS